MLARTRTAPGERLGSEAQPLRSVALRASPSSFATRHQTTATRKRRVAEYPAPLDTQLESTDWRAPSWNGRVTRGGREGGRLWEQFGHHRPLFQRASFVRS